jgi:hypothetical protein
VQPYVIKQGDYLALLAFQMGFDADSVWNDPANASLRTLRSDPSILFPGDVLQVPDPPNVTPSKQLQTGTTNAFSSNAPTVTVTLKFVDAELASQPVTVFELPNLAGLTTGADGTLALTVPVTQQTCTVVFTNDGTTFTCNVGSMDPMATVSGIAARLQNLGYLDPDATYTADDLEPIRGALRAFQADHGPPPSSTGGSTPPPSSQPPASGSPSSQPSPASQPSSTSSQPPPSSQAPPTSQPSSTSSQPPPASQPPPSSQPAPASQPPPSSQPAPASQPPPSSQPPASSQPPPSSQPPSSGSDNAGLADDGTLDPTLAALLLSVHGS